ncbi:pentatricopeptide repeat-containing protein, putative [Ricinus communis]|uniref:Pentatricopeptide repeat-containing protein, putative n=1 Tax=Ricinus communis TaxID=3988 RepID=B9RQJ8_RICCO|nr:pentatricopeptide repeat-containing protein, putative [Ricinus communis]
MDTELQIIIYQAISLLNYSANTKVFRFKLKDQQLYCEQKKSDRTQRPEAHSDSEQCSQPDERLNHSTCNRSSPKLLSTFHFSFNQTPSYYAAFLQSCITQKALIPGKQLHASLCHVGLQFDRVLAPKLVNLYCICNSLCEARLLFDKIPKRNLFLWNVLIRGYAWYGPYEASIQLYYKIFDYGLVPDNFTFPFVLKACSALSAIEDGRLIHEQVMRSGWERDVFVGAALIDMYSKCGCVDNAREVFHKFPVRDAVLWNSMLAAYSQNGKPDKSLALCSEMVLAGVRPTEATLVTVISASADIAALPQGRELHGFAWRRRFESNDKVKTTLIDMYAKCGTMKVAQNLFEQLRDKNVVSWNAIITGYAMHGYSNEVLILFDRMREEAKPDHITFVGVLLACSNGGLLDKEFPRYDRSMEESVAASSHPNCVGKCMGCFPCTPVLVTVPSQFYLNAAEYYPVLWKCTCGDHLYHP